MRMTRNALGIAALCALAAGCGGGYESPAAPSGGGQTSPPPAGPTPIAVVGDRGGQSFNPNPATFDAARAVAWRNNDSIVHRIVANDASFDTGNLAPGATSATITLPANGTNYHCSLHPGMVGAVNAAGGAPPPPCEGQYC
jgi:plastocyanin